jgi:hypothetical protein
MTKREEKKEKALRIRITTLHLFDDQARKKRHPDTHTQLIIARILRREKVKVHSRNRLHSAVDGCHGFAACV